MNERNCHASRQQVMAMRIKKENEKGLDAEIAGMGALLRGVY